MIHASLRDIEEAIPPKNAVKSNRGYSRANFSASSLPTLWNWESISGRWRLFSNQAFLVPEPVSGNRSDAPAVVKENLMPWSFWPDAPWISM